MDPGAARQPGAGAVGPERSLQLDALSHRSLLVGLSGAAVESYVDEWTVAITDVTATARTIKSLVDSGDEAAATARLPVERPHPLPPAIGVVIGATPDVAW